MWHQKVTNQQNCNLIVEVNGFLHRIHIHTVMVLNMHKNLQKCIIKVINYIKKLRIVKIDFEIQFKKKLKIKSLVAWSISEGRMDQNKYLNLCGLMPFKYSFSS